MKKLFAHPNLYGASLQAAATQILVLCDVNK